MVRCLLLCVLLLPGMRALCAQDAPCDIAYAPGKAVYPAIAKAAHVEGDVVFLGSFDHDGSLLNLQLISGPKMLVASAQGEVQQWRATPFAGSRTCPLAVHFREERANTSVGPSPQGPGHFTVTASFAPIMCQCVAPWRESRLHALLHHPLHPFRRVEYAY